MLMLIRLLQPENAFSPILVTLSGIVMLFTPLQFAKAETAILLIFIFFPPKLIVEGISTVSDTPIYFIISPLLESII